MFVPEKNLQPNLMFTSKARAYTSEALHSLTLSLPTNNRLSWYGLSEANTLASYYEGLEIMAVKSFITLAQGPML